MQLIHDIIVDMIKKFAAVLITLLLAIHTNYIINRSCICIYIMYVVGPNTLYIDVYLCAASFQISDFSLLIQNDKTHKTHTCSRINHFSEKICSARCPNPTVGDWRASAKAAKVGLGWTIFSQVVSMARKQSLVLALSLLITSSVPGSISSSRPILYHSSLASHAAL